MLTGPAICKIPPVILTFKIWNYDGWARDVFSEKRTFRKKRNKKRRQQEKSETILKHVTKERAIVRFHWIIPHNVSITGSDCLSRETIKTAFPRHTTNNQRLLTVRRFLVLFPTASLHEKPSRNTRTKSDDYSQTNKTGSHGLISGTMKRRYPASSENDALTVVFWQE